MADMVYVKITGLDELQKRLERMAKEDSKVIVKGATKEAAVTMRDAMVAGAPEETGFLKEHFNIKFTTIREGIGGEAFVGPAGKVNYPKRGGKKSRTVAVASVARFFEFGTSKMAAKPFMRQAFNSNKDRAMQQIIDFIKKALGL